MSPEIIAQQPEQPEWKVQVINDINDYQKGDIEDILSKSEMIGSVNEITDEDYEAIKARALFLADRAENPISLKALFIGAFADRMEHVGKISDEKLKAMSDDVVRSFVYADTGLNLTDEELELFRDSDTSLEEWARSRKELDVADFEVAVDESGNVVASGESKEEALRKAQENVEE